MNIKMKMLMMPMLMKGKKINMGGSSSLSLLLLLLLLVFTVMVAMTTTMASAQPYNSYQIGAGIYDVTGPASETGMMGYAAPEQISHGLHIRQRARAFVIVDVASGNRVVYVSIDVCMMFQEVKTKVRYRCSS